MDRTTRRLLALVGITLLVLAAFGGGVATYAALQDTESSSVSVGAAGNFPALDCPGADEAGTCGQGRVGLLAPVALGAAGPARRTPLTASGSGRSS